MIFPTFFNKVYNGAFKDDMRHGHGVYVWPEQGKYECYFEQDKKHGYGIFTMNNGDKFEVKSCFLYIFF